jgi:hypothetical protein
MVLSGCIKMITGMAYFLFLNFCKFDFRATSKTLTLDLTRYPKSLQVDDAEDETKGEIIHE